VGAFSTCMLSSNEQKVLTLLEINARMPISNIAKKVRLSVEGTKKIINRLESKKIIANYYATINHSKLGRRILPVYLKLKDLNSKAELVKILKKSKAVIWFKFCQGSYDLALSLFDYLEAEKLLRSIEQYTLEKDLLIVTEAYEMSKNFSNIARPKAFQTINSKDSLIELNEDELLVLKLLRQNAFFSLVEFAKRSGFSVQRFRRIKNKLESEGIITGYKSKVNVTNLGLFPGSFLINSKGDCKKLVNYCKEREDFTYVVKTIGKFDISVTFNAKSIKHIYSLTEELRRQFPEIKSMETLTLVE